MKKIFVIAACILCPLLLSACQKEKVTGEVWEPPIHEATEQMPEVLQETVIGKTKLIMGTNADFPPFEEFDAEGNIVGFDIEIGKAITEHMGVELEIVHMDFDALIPALQSKKVDFIIAGITAYGTPDADKRRDLIQFSDPYYDAAAQVIIVKEKEKTILSGNELMGKTLGVQKGTTGETLCSEIQNAAVNAYPTGLEAVEDLLAGNLDAVIIDDEPAKYFVQDLDGLIILEDPLTTEQYAVGLRKNDPVFLQEINIVIKNLKDSGHYNTLVEQYFNTVR